MTNRIAHIGGVVALLLTGCGSDGTDPGSGSQTLLVDATLDYEGGGLAARVDVQRAGRPVTDAVVRILDGGGEVVLTHRGDGEYRGSLPGWRSSYALRVLAGAQEEDRLYASLAAPDPPALTSPAPGIAFDPRLAKDGVVDVRWAGDAAMRIRVRTKEYDSGFTEDTGRVLIPATYFVDDHQDLRLERENETDLAGGAPGSRLRARIELRTELVVLNPF